MFNNVKTFGENIWSTFQNGFGTAMTTLLDPFGLFSNDDGGEKRQQAKKNIFDFVDVINSYMEKDADVEPVITPVIDTSNLEENTEYLDYLKSLFLNKPFTFNTRDLMTNAQQANPSNYGNKTPEQLDYTNQLIGLRGDLGLLGSKLAGNQNGMAGMRIVLDSGAIVGAIVAQIDSRLGRNGFYADREG